MTKATLAEKRRSYIKRQKAAKILSFARTCSFIAGILNFISCYIVCETDGSLNQCLFYLCSIVFLVALAAWIEYHVNTYLNKNGDLEFKCIFDWQFEYEDTSYKTWLRKYHLSDTPKNFRTYLTKKGLI